MGFFLLYFELNRFRQFEYVRREIHFPIKYSTFNGLVRFRKIAARKTLSDWALALHVKVQW